MNNKTKEIKQLLLQEAAIVGPKMEAYDIPPGKIDVVADYLLTMRLKNPQMKVDRLVRKTAEYFKLQLKPQEHESSNV